MRIESSVLVLRATEFIDVSLFLTHFRSTKEGLVNIDRNNRSTPVTENILFLSPSLPLLSLSLSLSLALSRTPEASA